MPVPVYYTPATLVAELYDDLKAWLQANKGTLSVAADPYNFLELLGDTPAGYRVVLHWEGDTNPSDNEQAGCFVPNRLSIGVTCNLGLTASPELSLIKPSASRPALLQLVDAVRDYVRGHVFAAEVSSQYILYKGAEPVVLPEGMPLRAYRLSFELTAALSPVEYRTV